MVPTRRLAALAFVAVLVAVALAVSPVARLPLALVDASLLLGVALDALLLRGRRTLTERHAPNIFSVGRANTVSLVLRNTSRRTLRGTVADDVRRAVARPVVDDDDLVLIKAVEGGDRVERAADVAGLVVRDDYQADRDSHRLGPADQAVQHAYRL